MVVGAVEDWILAKTAIDGDLWVGSSRPWTSISSLTASKGDTALVLSVRYSPYKVALNLLKGISL